MFNGVVFIELLFEIYSASNDSLAGNVDDPEGALDALMQVCV